MIRINGIEFKRNSFRDGTLKSPVLLPVDQLRSQQTTPDPKTEFPTPFSKLNVIWNYESDDELFLLYSLVSYYRDEEDVEIFDLYLPYVPNARQDRPGKGLFTLQYFAEIINSLNFHRVYVFDPHSAATMALLRNSRTMSFEDSWENYKKELASTVDAVMYPDTGAAKRYEASGYDFIGYKHRDSNDDIDQFELFNFKEGTKSVLIIDDICSSGLTFYEAAKALKERGVEKVYVCVSHCENAVMLDKLQGYVDKIYTTDSVCTLNSDMVEIYHLRYTPTR